MIGCVQNYKITNNVSFTASSKDAKPSSGKCFFDRGQGDIINIDNHSRKIFFDEGEIISGADSLAAINKAVHRVNLHYDKKLPTRSEICLYYNPVTDRNKGQIKSKLVKFLTNHESFNYGIRDTLDLMQTTDKDVIFNHGYKVIHQLKTKYDENWRYILNSFFDGELFDIQAHMLYREVKDSSNKDMLSLIKIFSPKSKNGEVITIENEIKKLGLKEVNLGDDIQRAKILLEVLKKCKEEELPLPKNIIVSPLLNPMMTFGLSFKDWEKGNDTVVFSNFGMRNYILEKRDNEFSKAVNSELFKLLPREGKREIITELKTKFAICDGLENPLHSAYHEIAHLFNNDISKKFVVLSDTEMKVAKGVSEYAGSNYFGSEYVSEFFAKLMTGRKPSKPEIDLYLKLGGILPKFLRAL